MASAARSAARTCTPAREIRATCGFQGTSPSGSPTFFHRRACRSCHEARLNKATPKCRPAHARRAADRPAARRSCCRGLSRFSTRPLDPVELPSEPGMAQADDSVFQSGGGRRSLEPSQVAKHRAQVPRSSTKRTEEDRFSGFGIESDESPSLRARVVAATFPRLGDKRLARTAYSQSPPAGVTRWSPSAQRTHTPEMQRERTKGVAATKGEEE